MPDTLSAARDPAPNQTDENPCLSAVYRIVRKIYNWLLDTFLQWKVIYEKQRTEQTNKEKAQPTIFLWSWSTFCLYHLNLANLAMMHIRKIHGSKKMLFPRYKLRMI